MLKEIYENDTAVSELVGTLLLIAITVILMGTLGLFLFTNVPTGNPVKAEMQITANQENDGKGNMYLILIDQVTENIKINSIELDLTLQNYSLPVILSFNQKTLSYQYPVIVEVVNTGIYHIENITMANASTGFKIYTPFGVNLSYVSVVDINTNSVIAQSPVKSISVDYSSGDFTSLEECGVSTNAGNAKIEFSNSGGYFEYNTTSFNATKMSTRQERSFYNLTIPHADFPFNQLKNNSSSGKNYQLNISFSLHIPKGYSLNITLLTSEPTNISLIGDSFYNRISSQGISNGSFIYLNKSFAISGVYEIVINYDFDYVNGILDAMFLTEALQ
ncbi:MAG: type IV pilin [Candidatus Thermoplasmatota archaeon]|nr:type IV pilin [Candidatus Thermoplasmatota archaeon]MCL5790873.1 type IV pilin [Candidatus Thermoplasmatota archaeon]